MNSTTTVVVDAKSHHEMKDLSDEMLILILSFCSPKEVIRLRQTCRRLRNLTGDPRIWQNLLAEYGIRRESIWPEWTAEEMYQAVHGFRELLGYWRGDLEHFGFLVRVKVDESGIVAYDCLPPLDDSVLELECVRESFDLVNGDLDYADVRRLHEFRFRPLFALRPASVIAAGNSTTNPRTDGSPPPGGLFSLVCYHSRGPHLAADQQQQQQASSTDQLITQQHVTCGQEIYPCLRKTENGFCFTCVNKSGHQPQDVQYWLEMEHGLRAKPGLSEDALKQVLANLRDEKDYDLRLEKYDAKSSLSCFSLSQCMEYSLPQFGPPTLRTNRNNHDDNDLILKAGFYFGHFNWHGWEILNVYFTNDKPSIVGEKVTGDQMIPVGKTSFRVELRRPIRLDYEYLSTMATLRTAVNAAPLVSQLQVQPQQGPPTEIAQQVAVAASSSSIPPESTAEHQPKRRMLSNDPDVGQQEAHRFRVPKDCAVLGTTTIPEHYTHCFRAEGQIAFPNYYNPRYLPCVCVVFSPEQFGLLWLSLKCFMPMYKALNYP